MKTAIRWLVVGVVGVAAVPYGASARSMSDAGSPTGNGIGDGEANVPFASSAAGVGEPGHVRGGGGDARAAGRGGRAAARRPYRAAPVGAAAQTDDEREFEQRVWTAP